MERIRVLLSRPCAGAVLAVLALGWAQAPGFRAAASGSAVASAARPPAAVLRENFARTKPTADPHQPPAVVKTPPAARVAPAAPARDRDWIWRGLGAWIDLYDFELDPRQTVTTMRRSGVRTLYLQTGRTNTRSAIDPRVGPWLAEAHRQDLKVVGWYLPYYSMMKRDVARTAAIARYSYNGHRFDGLGIDIEFRGAVKSPSAFAARAARHARLVRRLVGEDYPLSVIPPTPLQMQVAPNHWRGFPWRALAAHSDAILLMSYWSDRAGCPVVRKHCAYEFTALNVRLTRELSRDRDIVIHIIGGVGDSISTYELNRFVRAAKDSGAQGASIYDVATTQRAWWPRLATLRRLGDPR